MKYIIDTDDYKSLFEVKCIGLFGIGDNYETGEPTLWSRMVDVDNLEELPSAQPHSGTWQDRYGMFACSECGREYMTKHHYCPHCGATMMEED